MAPKRKQVTRSSSKAKSAAAQSSSSPPPKKTKRQEVKVKRVKAGEESDFAEEPELELVDLEDEDGSEGSGQGARSFTAPVLKKPKGRGGKKNEEEVNCRFLDEPIPEEEARRRWPNRFEIKAKVRSFGLIVDTGSFRPTLVRVQDGCM